MISMPTINDFIAHRWAEAKEALRRLDPSYVTTLEAAASLSNWDFVSPDVTPSHRLPKRWTALLETSTDLVEQLEHLQHCVSGLEPLVYEGLDGPQTSSLELYHLSNWQHHAYALVEKVQVLINIWVKLSPEDVRPSVSSLSDRWRERLKVEVRDKLEPYRTPTAHGIGGVGVAPRGITEDQLWEAAVVLPIPAERIVEEMHISRGANGGRWAENVRSATDNMVATIGQILADAESELEFLLMERQG